VVWLPNLLAVIIGTAIKMKRQAGGSDLTGVYAFGW
jgi:hypothetical protein